MMTMMMKTNLSGPFILLVILSSASGLGSVVRRKDKFVAKYLTWHEAQDHCRSEHSDLITLYTDNDPQNLNSAYYNAWFGLYKDLNEWVWSSGGTASFRRWNHSQPHEHHACSFVHSPNQRMYGSSCGRYLAFFCQTGDNYNYKFITMGKNWSQAQKYCRTQYDDLKTFTSSEELERAVIKHNFQLWTGLHRDGGTWRWSAGMSEYRSWASNEPDDNDDCVSISSGSKEMYTNNCTVRFPFFCFRDNLILVKENLTWEEALLRCRSHSYELLSVQPGLEHIYVMNKVLKADTEEVWVGLRFLAGHWMWINTADILYPDLPPCPINGKNCGVLSKTYTGNIEIRDCTERKNVICYKP